MKKIQKTLVKIFVSSFFPKEKRRQIRSEIMSVLDGSPDDDSHVKKTSHGLTEDKYLLLETLNELLEKQAGNIILILDHNWGGGANAYRENRIRELLAENRVVILATYSRSINIDLEVRCADKTFSGKMYSLLDFLKYDKSFFRKVIVNELVSWRLGSKNKDDVFSVPAGLSRDIPVLLEQMVILSRHFDAGFEHCFHDYFPLCPSITLLDHKLEYCGVVEDDQVCMNCLQNHPQWPEHFLLITRWRQAWQFYFDHIDEIRFFSKSVIDIARKVFVLPDEKINLVPHKSLVSFERKVAIDKTDFPVIGIAGYIQRHKGSQMVLELSRLLEERNSKARIVIIGELEGAEKRSNIIVHGKYEVKELGKIMEKYGVNIACIPSIWPETFSYVTKEYMDLEIPAICFGLGAPAERLRDWEYGYVVDTISAESLYQGIMTLFDKIYRTGADRG